MNRPRLNFRNWWNRDGKFYDPDTEDVPWFDKRVFLAERAFDAGVAQEFQLRLRCRRYFRRRPCSQMAVRCELLTTVHSLIWRSRAQDQLIITAQESLNPMTNNSPTPEEPVWRPVTAAEMQQDIRGEVRCASCHGTGSRYSPYPAHKATCKDTSRYETTEPDLSQHGGQERDAKSSAERVAEQLAGELGEAVVIIHGFLDGS